MTTSFSINVRVSPALGKHVCMALALSALSSACGGSQNATTHASQSLTAQSPHQTFAYQPPDGTSFVRYVTDTHEMSIAGTPYKQVEEDRLVWNVRINTAPQGYRVHQKIRDASFMLNGEAVLDSASSPQLKEIAIDLIVDKQGKVVKVEGAEKASALLVGLVPSDNRDAAQRMFAPSRLRSLAVARFALLTENVVGRPAQVGATWTLAPNQGEVDMVRAKTIHVDREESCGASRCLRVQTTYESDPEAVKALATEYVQDFVKQSGGKPAAVRVEGSTYNAADTLLVEPKTMLTHDAQFSDAANVTVAGPKRKYNVQTKNVLQHRYEYGASPAKP